MWFRKNYRSPSHSQGYKQSFSSFIDKEFQVKYTLTIVIAAAICMLVVTLPSYYFIQQNYTLFEDLAFEVSPNIVDYLRREKNMITHLFIFSYLSFLLVFIFIGLKMTSKIVGPIKVLKNHLKNLSRGRWFQKPLQIRDNDEFQDVISTYNYFYQSFQKQVAKDIDVLKSLEVTPENRQSYNSWKALILEKQRQLQEPESLISQAPLKALPPLLEKKKAKNISSEKESA